MLHSTQRPQSPHVSFQLQSTFLRVQINLMGILVSRIAATCQTPEFIWISSNATQISLLSCFHNMRTRSTFSVKCLISCPSTYFPWFETWGSFQLKWYNRAIVIKNSSKAKVIERKIELDSLIFRKLILLFNYRLHITTKKRRSKAFFPPSQRKQGKGLIQHSNFPDYYVKPRWPFCPIFFFFLRWIAIASLLHFVSLGTAESIPSPWHGNFVIYQWCCDSVLPRPGEVQPLMAPRADFGHSYLEKNKALSDDRQMCLVSNSQKALDLY